MPHGLNLHRHRERLRIWGEGWIVGRNAVRGSGRFCGAVRRVGRVALLLCCVGAMANMCLFRNGSERMSRILPLGRKQSTAPAFGT